MLVDLSISIMLYTYVPTICSGCIKDHKNKLDFQELIFAVVNWPNSEFYGAIVCIMHYLDQSAANQLADVFLIVGCGFL